MVLFIAVIPMAYGANNLSESYTPNYIYGSQPLGMYIGGIHDSSYNGIFIPDGGAIQYYSSQAGAPQMMSQFIQGQEQLMQSQSIEKQKQKLREKEIEDNLLKQYQQQIHNQ
jgi:hypothetical protein